MKKIAILRCLHSNRVCTGAACLKAFHQRAKSFAIYQGEELELTAFSMCNGCDQPYHENQGLQEKVERILSIGTEILHLGLCTQDRDKKECSIISEIADHLEKRGIKIIRGTH